ncbi:MAG: Rpn family recombination-promoting nuclease/putative transposase [Planctomycetes bacterium]|nr:Rpn family recombination-promoting nuclease/putative transposase [Planctomycetota bacterium]
MGNPHSHDGLFRFVFGEPEQMADLLRSCLPPALVAAIRWSTLRRLPDTFVDKVLGARRGDLFFSVEIGDAVLLLHVQTEHKSKVERFTALQQSGYTVRMLEAWRVQDPAAHSLPAVLTVVVYHGDKPWGEPNSVHELVDTRGWNDDVRAILEPLQLRQPFVLLDLCVFDDAAFARLPCTAITGLTLRFLQLLRDRGLDEVAVRVEQWRHLFREALAHPRGQDVMVALVSWCLKCSPANPDTLRSVMTKIQDEETPMRSMYDLLLEMGEERGFQKGAQQGLQRGMQQGMQQGMHSLLAGQLEARFGALTPEVVERLEAADAATLQRWSLRVFAANCIADVFRG